MEGSRAAYRSRALPAFRRRLSAISFAAVLLTGLLACLTGAAAPGHVSMTLRPLETDGWPSFLTRLGLSENHSYAILLQAPPRHPIDFRTPQSAVRSLNENMGDLLS